MPSEQVATCGFPATNTTPEASTSRARIWVGFVRRMFFTFQFMRLGFVKLQTFIKSMGIVGCFSAIVKYNLGILKYNKCSYFLRRHQSWLDV
jgi:hypothetical protein